jgi:hypothetical protein
MKVTLKDFLKEQASKGVDVPKIYEHNPALDPRDPENVSSRHENNITNPLVKDEIKRLANLILTDIESNDDIQLQWIAENAQKIINITQGGPVDEGFFDKIKNAVSGTIEYNANNGYTGSPEAQQYFKTDRRAKAQLGDLIKNGMSEEEAKAAVMYVFDKSGKSAHGFMNKKSTYDPQTKTLKVSTSGMNNPSLMA